MTAIDPTRAESDNFIPLTGEEDPLALDADEKAVCRYVRRHEPVTRDELAYESCLPLARIDRILGVFEDHDLVDIHVGWDRTAIRATESDQR